MVSHTCYPSTSAGPDGQIALGQEFKTSLSNMEKPHLYKKYENYPGMMAVVAATGRLKWEDYLSPGGRDYSKPRSHHCTPAWPTE